MKLKELFESEEIDVSSIIKAGEVVLNNSGFGVAAKGLTSLAGCPAVMLGDFNCYDNKLTSLIGGPSRVGGHYFCNLNKLTSLQGAPESTGGTFRCDFNELESLEGITPIIGENLNCEGNKLRSLKGIHKQIKSMDGFAILKNNPIKSHILGLLRIEGLSWISMDSRKLTNIMNKHLSGDRDIFACQDELMAAGYEAFAQL